MEDRFDIFGSLPDTIQDEWIDDQVDVGEKMDEYINDQRRQTGFELRYNDTLEPEDEDWRQCSDVLSRRDFQTIMREGWQSR